MPGGTDTGSQQLQYITIDDFSPGIYSDWYSLGGASPAPIGAAQKSGTFGCMAGVNGDLAPGPKLVRQVFDDNLVTITDLPSSQQNFKILNFRVVSSINVQPVGGTSVYRPNEDVDDVNVEDEGGALTNLYQSIDEAVLNTSDYITLESTSDPSTYYTARMNSVGFTLTGIVESLVITVVQRLNVRETHSNGTYGSGNNGPPKLKIGSTYYNPDTYTVDEGSVNTIQAFWFNNPATGVAWTQTDIRNFDSTSAVGTWLESRLNEVIVGVYPPPPPSYTLQRAYQMYMTINTATAEGGTDPDDVFYGYQWYQTFDAGTSYKQVSQVKLYKFWDTTVPTYTPATVTTSTTVSPTDNFGYGYIGIDVTRANNSAPTTVGTPTIIYSICPSIETSAAIVQAFPSNTTPTSDSTASVTFTNLKVINLFAHQDRMFGIVIAGAENFGTSASIGYEVIRALNTNVYNADSGTNTAFVNENPSAVGTVHSSNASELLVIKVVGGGYVMRGDVTNPTIVRLPGLPSAQEFHRCTPIPGGVAYGTRSSVMLWTGGDGADSISQQLDDGFWIASETDPFLGNSGSMTFSYPYLFVPNAFFFDSRKQGWWRLKSTNDYTYAWNQVSSSGKILCAPPFMTEDIPICDIYDPLQATSSYSWTSQPLPNTQTRTCEFREIVIVAQGQGTITFTLTGLDGNSSGGEFEFNSPNQPLALKASLGLISHDVIINILANSGNTNIEAPRIYRLSLGFQQGVELAGS